MVPIAFLIVTELPLSINNSASVTNVIRCAGTFISARVIVVGASNTVVVQLPAFQPLFFAPFISVQFTLLAVTVILEHVVVDWFHT